MVEPSAAVVPMLSMSTFAQPASFASQLPKSTCTDAGSAVRQGFVVDSVLSTAYTALQLCKLLKLRVKRYEVEW